GAIGVAADLQGGARNGEFGAVLGPVDDDQKIGMAGGSHETFLSAWARGSLRKVSTSPSMSTPMTSPDTNRFSRMRSPMGFATSRSTVRRSSRAPYSAL